jgi:hypothetical protein
MSGTFYNLNTKYNWLLALFNGLPVAGDIMTLSTNQVATGEKTFNTLPKSVVVPVANDELTNKLYVDTVGSQSLDQVLTIGNAGGGQSISGLNDVELITINGGVYPPISLPENVSVLPAGPVATSSVAGSITSMYRIRVNVESASLYRVNASYCGFVNSPTSATMAALSFSLVMNPVLNLNSSNLLLNYQNIIAPVTTNGNLTLCGTSIFSGAQMLNGTPEGLVIFFLNVASNTIITTTANPDNQGLFEPTFYFEKISN